eukprot:scaffold3137_cov35-Cyclotella_meneghiniana.AAC.4
MVGCATGTCYCGIKRRPGNKKDPEVCAGDGFDHMEEYCCNCLLKEANWVYYDDDACQQCKRRSGEILLKSDRK